MMPDESDSENYDETCEESPPECESIIFEAGSPIDRSESLDQLKESYESLMKSENEKRKKDGCFIGFLTKALAEEETTERGQFFTYYLIDGISLKPPKDSNISLDLYICYLNSRRHHEHYPIIKTKSAVSNRIFYQVGTSDPSKKSSSEPIFSTIKSLLKYYTVFAHVHSISKSGKVRIEIFAPN